MEIFLRYLPPTFSPTPHPTLTHTLTHQEQDVFVGLIRPAPLEGFSINKPSFMGR